jgi:hypothetical protein
MELTFEVFASSTELVDYVNKNGIKKEDIVGIVEQTFATTLFYWKEKL